jgi:sec-independent protein translocase protein TatB
MIPDIGWVELLIIAAATIIVVGPKDLPRMMRVLGQWLGKARGLAREFQRSFDDLVKESELDDLRKEVEELKKFNPIDDVKKALDPTDELRDLDKTLKEDMAEVEAGMKEKPEAEPETTPEPEPEAVEPVPGEDLQGAQSELEAERSIETPADAETSAVKP